MDIQKLTLLETKQIISVHKAAIQHIPESLYSPAQKEAWGSLSEDFVRQSFEMRPLCFGVFDAFQCLQGYIWLSSLQEIWHLYVLPSAQKKGIGSALLAYVETHVAQGNLVVSASLNAAPFYLQRGFALQAAQMLMLRGVELPAQRLVKTNISL